VAGRRLGGGRGEKKSSCPWRISLLAKASTYFLKQAPVRGENLKSDGCPKPRSGVRAVAQVASPGIDFRDNTSREAAAELQILPPLRGWDVNANAHPALARWAMFARRFAVLGNRPISKFSGQSSMFFVRFVML